MQGCVDKEGVAVFIYFAGNTRKKPVDDIVANLFAFFKLRVKLLLKSGPVSLEGLNLLTKFGYRLFFLLIFFQL
eukprot:XP_001705917.1 Hypothetical protein GL50803_24374 [Giardia lamblia ATCC 50803]